MDMGTVVYPTLKHQAAARSACKKRQPSVRSPCGFCSLQQLPPARATWTHGGRCSACPASSAVTGYVLASLNGIPGGDGRPRARGFAEACRRPCWSIPSSNRRPIQLTRRINNAIRAHAWPWLVAILHCANVCPVVHLTNTNAGGQ
jgi:hypothetical protein